MSSNINEKKAVIYMVGIDFSHGCSLALEHALTLAHPERGDQLFLVHARKPVKAAFSFNKEEKVRVFLKFHVIMRKLQTLLQAQREEQTRKYNVEAHDEATKKLEEMKAKVGVFFLAVWNQTALTIDLKDCR